MQQSLEARVRQILNRVKTPGSGEAGHAQRIPDAVTEVAKEVDSVDQRLRKIEDEIQRAVGR